MSLRFNLIKDIDNIKNDSLIGLTFREVVFCGLAIIGGGVTYFFTKNIVGDDLSSILSLIVASPFALTALFKKNGMNFWEYIKALQYFKNKNQTLYFSSYDADLLINSSNFNASNDKKKNLFDRLVDKIVNTKNKKKEVNKNGK